MVMNLSEEELRVVRGMRKERERELRRIGCRPGRTYPYVLYENGGVKVVKPDNGKHSGYAVYIDEELLCICVYRKGAMAVAEYVLGVKSKKEAV